MSWRQSRGPAHTYTVRINNTYLKLITTELIIHSAFTGRNVYIYQITANSFITFHAVIIYTPKQQFIM